MRIGVIAMDVNPPFAEGGAKAIFSLYKKLSEMGHEIHIITTQPFTFDTIQREKTEFYEGVYFHRVMVPLKISVHSKYSITHITAQIALTYNVVSILKKYHFDIIHGYSGASILALRTLLGKKISNAPSLHTFASSSYVPILGSSFFFNHLKSIDKIIVTSNALYTELLGIVKIEQLSIIPFGIDIKKYYPGAKSNIRNELKIGDSPIVLYVGHLYEEKGVKYLVKASTIVIQDFPETKFIIAWSGLGDQLNEIRDLIHKMDVEKNFFFIGKREDIAGIYSESTVFVLPLISEKHTLSHPVTLLESMACETPVITTDFPNNHEIIEDRKNGIIIDRENHKELANKICMIMADPVLGQNLGKEARKTIQEKFNLEKSVKLIQKIYEDQIYARKYCR